MRNEAIATNFVANSGSNIVSVDRGTPPEISVDTILALARSHGFFSFNKSLFTIPAAQIIARTVEFRIRKLIEEAIKIIHHSSRTGPYQILTVNHIKIALKSLKMAPCLSFSKNSLYRYIGSSRSFRGDRIVRRESYRIHNPSQIQSNSILSPKVRLIELIYQDVNKPTPASPSLTLHWIAVDGKILKIFENIAYDYEEKIDGDPEITKGHHSSDTMGCSMMEFKNESSNNSSMMLTMNNGSCNNFFEMSPYLNNIFALKLEANFEESKSNPFIIPKVRHFLGKEQLIFIEEVKSTLRMAISTINYDVYRDLVKLFKVLRDSSALEQLLPYICCFFAIELRTQLSLGCTIGALILVKFVDCVARNPNLRIHYCIHQIVHPLLCVVLSDYLEIPKAYYSEAFRLRTLAAKVLGNISKLTRYNKERTEYLDFILIDIYSTYLCSPNTSLTGCYGAIRGVMALGDAVSNSILIPVLPTLAEYFMINILLIIEELSNYHLDYKERELYNYKLDTLNELLLLSIQCFGNILERKFYPNEIQFRNPDVSDKDFWELMYRFPKLFGDVFLAQFSSCLRKIFLELNFLKSSGDVSFNFEKTENCGVMIQDGNSSKVNKCVEDFVLKCHILRRKMFLDDFGVTNDDKEMVDGETSYSNERISTFGTKKNEKLRTFRKLSCSRLKSFKGNSEEISFPNHGIEFLLLVL